jgi:flagellar biosynthesis protein FlhG
VQRFWAAADVILLAVTPAATSVTDAYASIKRAASDRGDLAIGLLVNRVPDDRTGQDVYRRIDASCQRFLGFGVALLGTLPEDTAVPAAAAADRPFVLSTPGSAGARSLESLARRLIRGGEISAPADRAAPAQVGLPAADNFVISSPAGADFGR